jgi:hypothetical protein
MKSMVHENPVVQVILHPCLGENFTFSTSIVSRIPMSLRILVQRGASPLKAHRLASKASKTRTRLSLETRPVLAAASAVVTTSILLYSASKPVHNDADIRKRNSSLKLSTEGDVEDGNLSAIVWGSNKYGSFRGLGP